MTMFEKWAVRAFLCLASVAVAFPILLTVHGEVYRAGKAEGFKAGVKSERDAAVKSKVGYYEFDDQTGGATFRYWGFRNMPRPQCPTPAQPPK